MTFIQVKPLPTDYQKVYVEQLNILKKRELDAAARIDEANYFRAESDKECARLTADNIYLLSELNYYKQELDELQERLWYQDVNGTASGDNFADNYLCDWGGLFDD